MHAGEIDAVFVLQQAADEERRGLGVKRNPDAFALEVLRRLDRPAVDGDEAVPEHAGRKHRHRHHPFRPAASRLMTSELDISQASNSRFLPMRSKICRGSSMARKLRSIPSGFTSPV
jgi:hypothetical protein